jgi:SAM-dependent methyltransferase
MTTVNDYDEFAAAYTAENDANVWNAYYERPASLALAGEVEGLDVLDAGCGAGAHAAALTERGATVTGIDLSAGLLEIARQRLGVDVSLIEADLGKPLPLASGSFDLVLASLVMHYLEDWGPTLVEFHRVLRPGGRLVISTHHPFMDHQISGADDYFATYEFEDQWVKQGRAMTMRYWHRPLHAMTDALTAAGFWIQSVSEPQPLAEAESLFPQAYETLTTKPRFIFFAAARA